MKSTLVAAIIVVLSASSGYGLYPVITLSASSTQEEGLGVTNILDGSLETRWSSAFADDQWVVIDFRQAVTCDAVFLAWEAAFPREYKLLVSDDEQAWDEVYSITNFTGGYVTNSFAPRYTRCVKIHAVKRDGPYGNSIKEADIRSGGASVIPRPCEVEAKYAFHIDVNQAFYAPASRKTAIIRAMDSLTNGSFLVTDSNAAVVLGGAPAYWGPYWGRHFWTIDFSAVTNEGAYEISASFSSGTQAQAQVFVGTSNILAAMDKAIDYFYTQRCGTNIPGWHQACHLDDGVLPGGAHFEASGGWHDCAAFDKELYTAWLPVYFFAAIAAEADEPWRSRLVGEARWGADWIMKMVDTNGYTWCHVESGYVPDEDMDEVWSDGTPTDNISGNGDDRPMTVQAWGLEEPCQALCAGALARLGDLVRDEDPAYSAQCMERAGRMIRYLMQREDQSGANFANDTSPYIDYQAGRLLADIYLYGTDSAVDYYADARRRIEIIAAQFCRADGDLKNASNRMDSASTQLFTSYAALLFMYDFAKRAPDDPAVETIKRVFTEFVENQMAQRTGPTPYGQAQIMATNTLRNFPWPESSDPVSQGRNCYWLSMATICFMADDLLETNAYSDIGAGQIDWVAGKNPFGVSTIADVGYRFPRMYTKWAFMVDHPAEDGVIPGGAICGIGGNAADEPMLDMRDVDLTDWLTNEYWNPPTAWFAMACWRLLRWTRGLASPARDGFHEAYLAFAAPQRPRLVRHFTEAEHHLRQVGSEGLDYKGGASGGQVLGLGWGDVHGDYVDYELFVARPLVDPTLHVRYACGVGAGRTFDVRWDDHLQCALACTNTGGWGGASGEYSWASATVASATAAIHKLTLAAQGASSPVNLDCWYLAEGQSVWREAEDHDSQSGSAGPDLKTGASGGEVLGDGWAITTTSEAVYNSIAPGSQTGAWLNVWYACGVSSGRVLNVWVDDQLRAHLACPDTGGWGWQTGDFRMVSARIGGLDGSAYSLKFTVPGPGDGVNLDCFSIGTPGPDFLPPDADQDGLSDEQELVCGTSSAEQDSDGDGIADGNEVQFGLSGQVTDPDRPDTDGDRLDDGEEWVSGTDPRNDGSFLHLDAPGISPSGKAVICWPSVSNRFYTLSRCDGLGTGSLPFVHVAIDLSAAPPLNGWTDQVTEGGPFFYRLKVRR